MKSDLNKIKEMAIGFLNLEIYETDFPFIISHPFFSSPYISYNNEIVNFIEKPEIYNSILEECTARIRRAKTIDHIIIMIQKNYRLAFLKYIKEYLSEKDFGYYLGIIWTESENPNQDPNVKLFEIIKWFKSADKESLMNDGELKIYNQLPEKLKVYRGVAVDRKHDGISWTMNYEEAVWFSNRFNRSNKTGYIRSGYIDKKDVLAFFNRRGEDEIVIDVKKLKE